MRSFGLVWLIGGLSLPYASSATAARAQSCSVVSIGIDSTHAYTRGSASAILGEGIGQTFFANDTLILSVTVWRPALQDSDFFPMKFWITNVDSFGTPQTHSVVLDGDTLRGPVGDGVHEIPIRYTFDPPFALPHRGQYFFAWQNTCAGYFDVLYDIQDEYASGQTWRTYRSNFDGCILRAGPRAFPDDLIFKIEFCDSPTPVLRSTWGSLKVRYR